MAIAETLPALLADVRALRAEVEVLPTRRGGDPPTNTCNDLAVAIVEIGAMDLGRPPQSSAKQPSADVLAIDMARFREANAPREPRTERRRSGARQPSRGGSNHALHRHQAGLPARRAPDPDR